MKYSVDTSAILDGRKRYYPPDIFPTVWSRWDELIDQGIVIATEEVLRELQRQDDETYRWARDRSQMFLPIDNYEIQVAVTDILKDHRYLIKEFGNRSGADPWVIALAKINGCSVLTGEGPSGGQKKPHIPDVCEALGIRWLKMAQLFRDQGWVFR